MHNLCKFDLELCTLMQFGRDVGRGGRVNLLNCEWCVKVCGSGGD